MCHFVLPRVKKARMGRGTDPNPPGTGGGARRKAVVGGDFLTGRPMWRSPSTSFAGPPPRAGED